MFNLCDGCLSLMSTYLTFSVASISWVSLDSISAWYILISCLQFLLSRACISACAGIQPFPDGGLIGRYFDLVSYNR